MKKISTVALVAALVLWGVFPGCTKDGPGTVVEDEKEVSGDGNGEQGMDGVDNGGEETDEEDEVVDLYDDDYDYDDDGDYESYAGERFGTAYIPYALNEGLECICGSAGNFYFYTADIHGQAGAGHDIISSCTRSEWAKFVKRGKYGDKWYDISFLLETEFWDKYMGKDAKDPGMEASLYCYTPDSADPALIYSDSGEYRQNGSFYSHGGLTWGFDKDLPYDNYFTFGVDTELSGENTRPYDNYGAKYLFVLTIPAEEGSGCSDISFYAFLHAKDADTPSIIWGANPDFEPFTLYDGMDMTIDALAPEGVETFTVSISGDNALLGVFLLLYGFETDVEYDVLTNETIVDFLEKWGVPSIRELKGESRINFALTGLADKIYKYAVDYPTLLGGIEVSLTMKVTDTKGQTAAATAVLLTP